MFYFSVNINKNFKFILVTKFIDTCEGGPWPPPVPVALPLPTPFLPNSSEGFGKREGGWRGEGDEGKPDGGQAWRAVGDVAVVEKARPVGVGELHGHGEARGEEGGKTTARPWWREGAVTRMRVTQDEEDDGHELEEAGEEGAASSRRGGRAPRSSPSCSIALCTSI